MQQRAISTDRAPVVGFSTGTKAPLSQAIRYGNLIFCSGQGPLDPEKHEIVSDDFEAQVRQTLANLLAVVEAAGSSKDRILKCNCYLREIENFPAFNALYREFFSDCKAFPARTTTQAAPPREGVRVEIECIAAAAE
jgi:2-iminobutanoate/2-iminopropanoate deaminase